MINFMHQLTRCKYFQHNKQQEIYKKMWRKFIKTVQNKFRSAKKVTSEEKNDAVDCQICLNRIHKKNLIQICSCNHLYCNQCINQYVDSKMKSYEIIKCPDEKCIAEIDESGEFYLKLLNQKKQKYQKVKRFYFVSKNPSYKLCPKEQCPGTVKIDMIKSCECNVCKQKYCPKCLYKQHRGKCQKQSILHLQNDLKFIQCVRCDFIIEKNEGCDHIKCRCGYQLCYKCGGQWKGSSHTCIRSKSFQKVRSIFLSAINKMSPLVQNVFFNKVSKYLFRTIVGVLIFNLVIAIMVSAVQIFITVNTILMSIFTLSFINGTDSQTFETDQQTVEDSQSEEGSFWYWAFGLIVLIIGLYFRKSLKTRGKKFYIFSISGVITLFYYLLPNFIYMFYYEVLIILFIIQYSTYIIIFFAILISILSESSTNVNRKIRANTYNVFRFFTRRNR